MSYIPPHKRHSKDPVEPCPFPDSLLTKFNKNIDFKSNHAKGNAIVYSKESIKKWFLVGPDCVPPSLNLVPVSSDSVECKNEGKPLVLINYSVQKESEEEKRSRWMLVAEKIEEDLVFAYEQAKKRVKDHYLVYDAKLRLVARFGKIFFNGHRAGPLAESSPKNWKTTFSTDVPTSYIQHIMSKVVPSHKFCIEKEKATYIVKVSHYTRPNAAIGCKCTVSEDGQLSMYKAELNPLRHLVVDMSCIDENLDMRLMLADKRKLVDLTEKEVCNIKGLLDSATADPNVEGGLRWPLGKTSSRDGYIIFEVCHIRTTIYRNGTLRLSVRETDRLNERLGTWETSRGVTLTLDDLNSKLQEQNIDREYVTEMLRDSLGTIWDFLHCDTNLK